MDGLPEFEPISAKVDGHNLTLFVSGADRLAALLRTIDEAQNTLRLFYYMFSDDKTSHHVRDALIAAAHRGVKVTLLVDGFGSGKCADAVYAPLAECGVTFARFLPRWGRRYLLRNHQKIVVADEKRALVGGCNVADTYYAEDPEGKSWHDLMLSVEGPAALRLARYYDGLLRWNRKSDSRFRSLLQLLARRSEGKGKLRWLFSGPFRTISPLTRAIRMDIDSAKRLDMVEAYFSPNWGMLRRIGHVVRRGGNARIVTASRSDNNTTVAATRHCYRRLLRYGVEVAEYLPQMLHMKLIVVDDAVYIGSANFDMRSLYINAEIMLRIEDPAFAEQVRGLVKAHEPWCEPITSEMHKTRSSWLTRLRRLASYFVVSSLDFNVSRMGMSRD